MLVVERKLSMKETAAVLGIHRSTVSRLLDRGDLGFYQVGDRRICGEHHVAEYLALNERHPRRSLRVKTCEVNADTNHPSGDGA
jgi:excisionase family DNA binding protein